LNAFCTIVNAEAARRRPAPGLGATLKAQMLCEVPMSEKYLWPWNRQLDQRVEALNFTLQQTEVDMGFGRGVLFWLLGVPIPVIILLALFWHH
jgi:hypothetical protein